MSRCEDSEMFKRAAQAAREDSRRYWAKGGAADRKYPVHDDIYVMWPLSEERQEPDTERGLPG